MPGSQPFLDSTDPVLLIDHPENIQLWLPSAFPSSSRDALCMEGLPLLEYRLRCAQATNALHEIRNLRQLMRIVAVKTQSHIAHTQRTATRTRTLFDRIKIKLSHAVAAYQTSRTAIANLAPNEEFGSWRGTLLELHNVDIRGPGCDEGQSSTSCLVQSWIWTTAPHVSASPEDPDLQATLRVEWSKAQERARRFEEEAELIVEEMRRTLGFLEWKVEEWKSFATSLPSGASAIDTTTSDGVTAYANKQADIQLRLATTFIDDWYPLLAQLPSNIEWLKQYPRPSESKRRRLISNVRLYHSDQYNPQVDSLDTGEIVSDDEGVEGLCNTMDDYLEEFIDHTL